MANFIEVGHSKNVANFEDLISFCTAYGTLYNPGNAQLQIPALQTKYNSALASIEAVVTSNNAYKDVTNQREIIFKDLTSLATRIINYLGASGVSSQTLQDARSIVRKISGSKKKSKPIQPVDAPADIPVENGGSISSSRKSYDALLQNFKELVDLLTGQPLYVPNEADLTLAGLNSKIAAMQTATTNVTNAISTINTVRIARNKELYDKKTGLVKTGLDVKKYVKAIFGATSPEYKKMVKLELTYLVR